jgi:iron complex transport system ATP-binding protein
MKRPGTRVPKVVLEIEGLEVRRGKVRIVKSLSWRISAGEHWVILGSNGSGKTTLLAALTGYVTPTCGSISVLGARYGRSDWRELRKRIGLVSSAIRGRMPEDEPAWITVAGGRHGVIDYWGDPPARERRAAVSLLAAVGAGHLRDREWTCLSQGERQRVLIARALMAKPDLLILDEPCAGLDPVARERFLAMIESLARSDNSPALALVTHHVEEILPAFTHALLLRDGAAVAAAPVSAALTSRTLSEVFDAPLQLRRRSGRYALTLKAKVSPTAGL